MIQVHPALAEKSNDLSSLRLYGSFLFFFAGALRAFRRRTSALAQKNSCLGLSVRVQSSAFGVYAVGFRAAGSGFSSEFGKLRC